jgi:hypothetical protein
MAGSGCWTRQDIPADPAIQQQNNLAALSADIKLIRENFLRLIYIYVFGISKFLGNK